MAETRALFARAGKLKLRQAETRKNAYGNNNICCGFGRTWIRL